MKPQLLLLTAAFTAGALGASHVAADARHLAEADAVKADAVKRCGRLGVMKVDPADLPEGVEPADVRLCADHPLSPRNLWGYGAAMPGWFPWAVVDAALDLYDGWWMARGAGRADDAGGSRDDEL